VSNAALDLAAIRTEWEATRSAFSAALGIVLETLEPGRATMRMPLGPVIMNEGGVVHGGAIASLCDTAFHLAHLSLYGFDEPSVTVDLTCNFLGAARPPHDLVAHARVIKGGRRVVFGDVSVYSDERIIAHATLNFMNLAANRR
jgi:uncharacterized protein (TIGR00369 family)